MELLVAGTLKNRKSFECILKNSLSGGMTAHVSDRARRTSVGLGGGTSLPRENVAKTSLVRAASESFYNPCGFPCFRLMWYPRQKHGYGTSTVSYLVITGYFHFSLPRSLGSSAPILYYKNETNRPI